MVSAASAAGFADLVAGIMALEIFFFFLNPQSGTSTAPSAQAPLLYSALELLLPLGVAGSFTAVGYIHHHLGRRHAHAAVPATGATNRRVSGVAFSILCVSVGVLDYYFFFVQPAGGAVDHAARARGIGLGALRALPTAATATFFWGMMLIVIAHVCAGGEGGGGAVAGAGQGATIQSSLRLLTKIAVGAAAGLAFLVAIAFCIKC